MTSRERVRKVLNHELPDRIPNGLGGCETEGLHVIAYDTLQSVLGVERKAPRVDTFMTNAVFELPVIQAMEGDIVLLASPNMCKSELRGEGVLSRWKEQELWGRTFSVPVRDHFHTEADGTLVWETCNNVVSLPGTFFFDGRETTDLMADFEVPDPDSFHPSDTIPEEQLRNLEKAAAELYQTTDLSICLGESIRDLQIAPGGMIGSMVLMMEAPEVMKALLEKCTEAALHQIRLLDQAVGKYVDILSIAHDLGDNRGVTIGADLWRSIYKPFYQRLFTGWREMTAMKVNLHSCGSVSEILGDLVECGLQVLNPVQTSAAHMSPQELKDRFGKDLVFWGGAYDAQLIPHGASYDEVYRAVAENIRILGKDGGFIFSGVHNLPADLPAEHLRAMLDALRDHREY